MLRICQLRFSIFGKHNKVVEESEKKEDHTQPHVAQNAHVLQIKCKKWSRAEGDAHSNFSSTVHA